MTYKVIGTGIDGQMDKGLIVRIIENRQPQLRWVTLLGQSAERIQ